MFHNEIESQESGGTVKVAAIYWRFGPERTLIVYERVPRILLFARSLLFISITTVAFLEQHSLGLHMTHFRHLQSAKGKQHKTFYCG